jgi:hypothetical protein
LFAGVAVIRSTDITRHGVVAWETVLFGKFSMPVPLRVGVLAGVRHGFGFPLTLGFAFG